MTPNRVTFAVVIVNYNSREHLRACLEKVQAEAPDEVVVVDNASSDGSAEMVKDCYPGITLCPNGINVGYGTAINQAMARCTSKYVLLLNSDTLLQSGALKALGACLDSHPRAAIVGPRLINTDGTLQTSCYPFPTPFSTLIGNTTLNGLIKNIPILRKHYLPAWPHNTQRLVPWVKGAVLAVRRQAFEAVGGFDESFFMYFEETDLCYRLWRAGWQVYFAPVTSVVHIGGASTMQVRTDMAVQFFASLRLFYERHYSRARLVELIAIVKIIVLIRWLVDVVRFHSERDTWQRAVIATDVAAWQRVLFGRWRAQATRR
jgi:GT2 family glycosyltransferase